MNKRIILQDILKSKVITFTTTLFVAVAAMLVSLAAILMVNLSGAVDSLLTKAQVPHFMQMHSGNIDIGRLSAFAEQQDSVEKFQVLEFLNIDNSEIILGENSLAGNLQDNGFSVQSKSFDYLFDLDGNIITVSEGEIYVPLCYMRDKTTKVGDKALIYGKEFIVKGFLRDAQMNSSLSTSKRFLVNDIDYMELKEQGNVEYLIEFLLKDFNMLGEFESAYISAELENNGPTVTYPLFKMINALSDGIMIGIIILISVLVLVIAFLCIRFTLLAKIEDDYSEIGTMKAIGIRISDIKKIYFLKYTAIASTGCIIGFIASLGFRNILLENIRISMGKGENTFLSLLFGIIGIIIVFFSILIYVNMVLKRFRNISPAQAVRFGTSQDSSKISKSFTLNKNKLFNINIFLGIRDVLVRKKLYITMLVIIVISTFIMTIPINLYNTISSKNFIAYMGVGRCDMRIDIQQTDNIYEKTNGIINTVNKDSTIEKSVVLTTRSYKVKMENDSIESIKVELGNHGIFPLEYSQGKMPEKENEIALSTMNSDELCKKVGDKITLIINNKERNFTVCGIYSDITNGGRTAKAIFEDSSPEIMWSIICTQFSDVYNVNVKVSEYMKLFPFAKVSGIDDFVKQTFGSTMDLIQKASYVAVIVALSVTLLIVLLFMKMLVIKDKHSIAVMKALGFTNSNIKVQYGSSSIFVLIIGIVLGTILANTVGEVIAGAVINSFGVSSFSFTINVLWAYFICPVIMIGSGLIATIIGTSAAGEIKISEHIKE